MTAPDASGPDPPAPPAGSLPESHWPVVPPTLLRFLPMGARWWLEHLRAHRETQPEARDRHR
jgi:hypothetical protein